LATGPKARFRCKDTHGGLAHRSLRMPARPPFGAAVLLGAILAPTDPVLASDVQVEHPFDSKPLHFSRTGAARWNDGTAFPFVMLGLGLFGAHDMAWGVALGRR